jgi:hypothetical protein
VKIAGISVSANRAGTDPPKNRRSPGILRGQSIQMRPGPDCVLCTTRPRTSR